MDAGASAEVAGAGGGGGVGKRDAVPGVLASGLAGGGCGLWARRAFLGNEPPDALAVLEAGAAPTALEVSCVSWHAILTISMYSTGFLSAS